MKPTLSSFPDLASLSARAADLVAEILRDTTAARGRALLCLAGGSTPKALYRLLADRDMAIASPPARHAPDSPAPPIDWPRVHIFFGDERCVPPDHPDSNFRSAHDALLARVHIPDGNIHRIRGELGPQAAADEYHALLLPLFSSAPKAPGSSPATPAASAAPATFDLTLLGMGADGHTASLFPGRDFAADSSRFAAAAIAPPQSPVRERVTLTVPCFNRSRRVIFLAAGADKREPLARVLASSGLGGDPALPASLVSCHAGVDWLVDQTAAPTLA